MEPKNLRYAKVNNHVFNSLSAAEAFCKRNEIDLDCIEYRDDPDLNFTCQQFAKIQMAVLDELKQRIDTVFQERSAEHARWIKKRDSSSGFDRDWAQDRAEKCCDEIQGIAAAREVVWKMYEDLMGITGWHNENVYGLKRGENYFNIGG